MDGVAINASNKCLNKHLKPSKTPTPNIPTIVF